MYYLIYAGKVISRVIPIYNTYTYRPILNKIVLGKTHGRKCENITK